MKKSNKKAMSKDERALNILNIIILSVFSIIFLYPIIYVLSNSLSSPYMIAQDQIWLFPKEITFASFEQLFSTPVFNSAIKNSLMYTFLGTLFGMSLTIPAAYFLSRKPKAYMFWLWFFIINMWLKAGVIPTYLNYVDLGLINSRWAPIIGMNVDVFNIIILKSFFDSIPKELEEAATIDGANSWKILTKIHLPLSVSALLTVAIFYLVEGWNSYFWPMVVIDDTSKQPLQVLLKKWVVDLEVDGAFEVVITENTAVSQDSFIYATIVVAMIPMMILYPFVQKYFQKGVMVGSVKG
ncbi:carbohydrate ABC transporter permease [Vallitalea okinawensis]|uniref:carbohydrate ABC transporter permease n=1 Tax=Vallitalea okinawensis TaxID=2078660 RepID=UPI000CFC4124|nr:carbohydrate ABC transporter permease [Vallitalea okinawensis]